MKPLCRTVDIALEDYDVRQLLMLCTLVRFTAILAIIFCLIDVENGSETYEHSS